MNSKYKCYICDIMCSGPENFQQHENCIKHKKKVAFHQDYPTNSTTEGTLADNNLQLFPCSMCNVQFRDFQSFQAHVNSLQHADMVRKMSSGGITAQDQLEGTLEKTDIVEVNNPGSVEVNTVNNPGSCLPFEGYNIHLGSFAHCVICKMQFSGPEQQQQHLAGKPHKKKLKLLGLNAEITQANGSAKNDIPNNLTSLYMQCDTCQLPFSGPIPYQQHLVSDGHKKKMIQKELTAVKLSFDTVDSDKIMPFIRNHEEAAGNDTSLCPDEKASVIDDSEDNKPFAKCTLCNMEFTGPEPYQLHIESVSHQIKIGIQHNSVSKVFYCDICDVPLSGPIPYNDHMNSPKHKKKVQSLELLKHLESNKSSGQDATQSDKINRINGLPTSANSEFYCEVCKTETTGPEPYRQHIYGEPHKKKERAANSFCNVENANNFQNGLSEKNDLKTNNFYISKDLILCEGLENIGGVSLDNLNVQVFYPDDEIVFDKPIKKNVVSNL